MSTTQVVIALAGLGVLVLYVLHLRRRFRNERIADATRRLRDDGPTWRTRNGRVLLIRTMDSTHLLNTINYVRRKAPISSGIARPRKYNDLLTEAMRRGLDV